MVDHKDIKNSDGDSEDLTPEEKLFRAVVSNSNDFDDFMEGDEQDSLSEGPLGNIKKTLSNVGEMFGDFFARFKPKTRISPNVSTATLPRGEKPAWLEKVGEKIQLQSINRTMGVIVILVVLYLFFDIFFGNSQPIKNLFISTEGKEVSLIPDRAPEPAKPLDYYLDPTADRNVFTRKPKPEPVVQPVQGEGGEEGAMAVEEMPTNLRLAGISWDDVEYVAMVEVEGEPSARFVRKDDKLPGDIDVLEVSEVGAKLSRQGKEWDLL